jgi:hypothetical protein
MFPLPPEQAKVAVTVGLAVEVAVEVTVLV